LVDDRDGVGSGAERDVSVGGGAGGLGVVDVPGIGRRSAVEGGRDGSIVAAGTAEAGILRRADEMHRGGRDADGAVEGAQCFGGGGAEVVG